MTQPSAPPRIRSEYQPGHKPKPVDIWEQRANAAPNDMTALVQLAYTQAVLLRTIKNILIWTLIILPILAVAALVVLSEIQPASSGF